MFVAINKAASDSINLLSLLLLQWEQASSHRSEVVARSELFQQQNSRSEWILFLLPLRLNTRKPQSGIFLSQPPTTTTSSWHKHTHTTLYTGINLPRHFYFYYSPAATKAGSASLIFDQTEEEYCFCFVCFFSSVQLDSCVIRWSCGFVAMCHHEGGRGVNTPHRSCRSSWKLYWKQSRSCVHTAACKTLFGVFAGVSGSLETSLICWLTTPGFGTDVAQPGWHVLFLN